LSKISYQWNRLEEAEEYVQLSSELSRRWGSVESQVAGLVILAKLELAKGDREKARETIHAADELTRGYPLTHWQSISLLPALARVWILEGNLERASLLVQKSGILEDAIPKDGEISTLQMPWYLTLLRLYQAQGEVHAVLALAERLLPKLEGANRVGRVIETLVLQALACQGKKDIDQALVILEKAFSLAQPGGYMRTFLDEGEPIAKLLFQARTQRIGTGYGAELLSAMGHAFGGALPLAQLLIEPLTLRELEVLKLIEAGYSNQEIAAELVISLPTVKRHISNIYTKLGTSSRTQAVARAKELNLFQ
jgi:LuxR family maltose regulon positive regulatory protein